MSRMQHLEEVINISDESSMCQRNNRNTIAKGCGTLNGLKDMWEWLENLIGKRPPKRDALGDRGENVAAHYLRKNGFKIIVRNFRCEVGEIDIIARDGKTLVFVGGQNTGVRRSAAGGSGEFRQGATAHQGGQIVSGKIMASRRWRPGLMWCRSSGRWAASHRFGMYVMRLRRRRR